MNEWIECLCDHTYWENVQEAFFYFKYTVNDDLNISKISIQDRLAWLK